MENHSKQNTNKYRNILSADILDGKREEKTRKHLFTKNVTGRRLQIYKKTGYKDYIKIKLRQISVISYKNRHINHC